MEGIPHLPGMIPILVCTGPILVPVHVTLNLILKLPIQFHNIWLDVDLSVYRWPVFSDFNGPLILNHWEMSCIISERLSIVFLQESCIISEHSSLKNLASTAFARRLQEVYIIFGH